MLMTWELIISKKSHRCRNECWIKLLDKVHEKSLERNLSTDKIFSQPPECLAELAYCLGFKDTNRIEISLEVEVFYETYRKVFENEDDPDR